MERECDHCDEATAEVMSLIDHEFTGAEVEALNKQLADMRAAGWNRADDLKKRAEAAEAELALARADVVAAAGELMVSIPDPGTEGARILLANVAMRREREQTRDELAKVRERLGGLVREWRAKPCARGEACEICDTRAESADELEAVLGKGAV